MSKAKSEAIPVRFDATELKQIDQLTERTRLSRSFIIQSAVRLALKRAQKGDRAWLLGDDITEEADTFSQATVQPRKHGLNEPTASFGSKKRA